MVQIVQVDMDKHIPDVRDLFWEYLQWANTMINREFGVNLDIASMLEQDMQTLTKFAPPSGRLFLARHGDHVAGMVCLKWLSDDTGELKRMYVRPPFRRAGVGHALVAELVAHAQAIGYHRLRLDSARFMHPAHALYRSVGFHEIAPYTGSEVPVEFQQHWIFMEKVLHETVTNIRDREHRRTRRWS